MALPASDPFDGSGALSADWTVMVGDPVRSSDECVAGGLDSDNEAFWDTDAFANDQYAEIVFGGTGALGGPMVRCSGTAGSRDGYLAFCNGGSSIQIYRLNGGAYDAVGSAYTQAHTSGDTIRLSVSGTTLTVSFNGGSLGNRTDANVASGSAGFNVNVLGGLTSFTANNVGAAVSAPMFRGS